LIIEDIGTVVRYKHSDGYRDVLPVTGDWPCPQQPVVTEEGSFLATAGVFWRCDSKQCVPRSKICDGVYDCTDKSDERRCCTTLFSL